MLKSNLILSLPARWCGRRNVNLGASLSSGFDGPYGWLDDLSSNFFKPGMSLIYTIA
jgi:hypothetical protein